MGSNGDAKREGIGVGIASAASLFSQALSIIVIIRRLDKQPSILSWVVMLMFPAILSLLTPLRSLTIGSRLKDKGESTETGNDHQTPGCTFTLKRGTARGG